MSFKKFSDSQGSEKPAAANDAARPTFTSDKTPETPAKKAPPPKSE